MVIWAGYETFVGADDYLADGSIDFLIENTSGAIVAGIVVGHHAQYTLDRRLGV